MNTKSEYIYETLKVTTPKEFVFNVELHRPANLNALTETMYQELGKCFDQLAKDENCRVIVLSGSGRLFCAGLDLMDAAMIEIPNTTDVARRGFHIRRKLQLVQESHTSMEKCPKPVLAAIHNACVGGGVDLVTAADSRYCTQDSFIQVKEVDVGLAADAGTLQRLPKVMGNDSLVRELCYTVRRMYADEGLQQGFVSRVFPDKDSMMSGVFDIAVDIASKSPVAVQGTKVNLLYSRDHSVQSGLDYMAAWNIGMVQSDDTTKAAESWFSKELPKFSKL